MIVRVGCLALIVLRVHQISGHARCSGRPPFPTLLLTTPYFTRTVNTEVVFELWSLWEKMTCAHGNVLVCLYL